MGGEQAVRGGEQAVRGGEQAVMGGEQAVRGGEQAVRGGEQAVMGGEQAVRGGEQAVMGGEQAVKGGEQAVRGGEQAVRGGEQAVRGGEQAVRGGEPAVRGGEPGLGIDTAATRRHRLQPRPGARHGKQRREAEDHRARRLGGSGGATAAVTLARRDLTYSGLPTPAAPPLGPAPVIAPRPGVDNHFAVVLCRLAFGAVTCGAFHSKPM
jgi:hypothetical protein